MNRPAKDRPKVFIGSSAEHLHIANAIHANLERHAQVTVWDQGAIPLSATTLEALCANLDNVDFSVFVVGPDDLVEIRGAKQATPRDNVILEIGLFIGRLGSRRCFLVRPYDSEGLSLRLPTDLLGVTTAYFDAQREDGNHIAATSPACQQMIQAMIDLGIRAKPTYFESASQTHELGNQEEIKKNFFQEIRNLKAAVYFHAKNTSLGQANTSCVELIVPANESYNYSYLTAQEAGHILSIAASKAFGGNPQIKVVLAEG